MAFIDKKINCYSSAGFCFCRLMQVVMSVILEKRNSVGDVFICFDRSYDAGNVGRGNEIYVK